MTSAPISWGAPCASWMYLVMPALFAAQVGLMWLLFGGESSPLASHVFPTNASWAVNPSVTGHLSGRPPPTPGGIERCPLVAWFTNGEGHHNCHH